MTSTEATTPQTSFQRFMAAKTAGHECSHAFSAHFLGVPLEIVTIVKESESLGHTALSKRASTFNPSKLTTLQANDYVKKHSIIGLAGNAGTLKFTGSCDWEVAGSEDLAVVRSLIFAIAISDQDAEVRMGKYWKEAQQIVNENWRIICRLADVLVVKKTMDAKAVDRVITSAKNKQEPEPPA